MAKAARNKKGAKGPGVRGRALDALRRKTLDPKENPENSLTAAILLACCPDPKKKCMQGDDDSDETATRYPDAFVPSPYTALLEPIAKHVWAQYQQDANQAHVALLNLIFRGVGGSFETTLDPTTTELDTMDDSEWEQVVTNIVDDMRHTPPDSILTCACFKGAVYANDKSKQSLAQEEYRIVLDHFWYLLGILGLSSAVSATNDRASSSSFDIERIRDLAMRMMELCGAGQPDLRSSATVAAMQLALAACDGTLEFQARLATANRQLRAAKAAKTNAKQKTLQRTVEALERSSADLEQVVSQTVVAGVFMKRYRDSDPYIRAFCLRALSQMMLKRPDLFLRDTYLKYYGWMMSDKDSVVRVAALEGLLVPFTRAQEQAKKSNSKSIHPLQVIDLDKLEKVTHKFLPRIAECVVDVSIEVQQRAMPLLLALNRHGFMDEVDNDSVWNQINLRALASDTTADVRRDALYFIMEQLEPFDEDDDAQSSRPERQKVDQIDAIATWVAHALSDGAVPMEFLRVHLTSYIVQSIRDMPAHAHLMTDWSAILRAIQRDTEANVSQSQAQRVTLAKQRVLLQIFASAAALEARSGYCSEDTGEGTLILDSDVGRAKSQLLFASGVVGTVGKYKKQPAALSGESLTVSLLKALPNLLEAYKGDLIVLRSLTTLPQYFVSSVLAVPTRKGAVQSLTDLLAELFLDSTDTTVLQNTCLALCVLANGDHARNREALMKLRNVAFTVKNRLFDLYGQATPKKNNGLSARSPQKQGDEEKENFDEQLAISLCLIRLRILSKRRYLGDLFAVDEILDRAGQEESTNGEDTDPCVHLCATIAQETARILREREVLLPEDEDSSIEIPKIWSATNPKIHHVAARSVVESLNLILSLTSWRLQQALAKERTAKEILAVDDVSLDYCEGDSVDIDEATMAATEFEKKLIIRMRDGLQKLLGLCFDQYLEEFESEEDSVYSLDHVAFSNFVQMHAGKVAGDLRSLFPKELSDAVSPLLRACALTEDSHLIGGFVRFFREKEDRLARNGKQMKNLLLLPMSRGICSSWLDGNRREAGTVLAHIDNSNQDSAKSVNTLCHLLKKIDPVRLLESHMASLRQGYADWIDSEPEEPESDRPTEDEMDEFAAAEQHHAESVRRDFGFLSIASARPSSNRFSLLPCSVWWSHSQLKAIESQARSLALTLGVGKLTDVKLGNALFGFVKEGMRYAFQSEGHGSEEDCNLGGHLTFLLVLNKYENCALATASLCKTCPSFFF